MHSLDYSQQLKEIMSIKQAFKVHVDHRDQLVILGFPDQLAKRVTLGIAQEQELRVTLVPLDHQENEVGVRFISR